MAVPGGDPCSLRALTEILGKIPAAEEARRDPHPAGGEGLAALHRVEERIARVLLGPEPGDATRVLEDRGATPALGTQSIQRVGVELGGLPGLLGVAGSAPVRVGAADEAELVGVDLDPLVLAQALDQHVARVVEPRDAALGGLGPGSASLPTILELEPRHVADLLEIAELVGSPDHAVEPVAALRLALDLHHLDEGLDLGVLSGLPSLLFEREVPIPDREDLTIGEIGIVRNRERLTAGVGLVAELAKLAPEVVLGR